MKSLKKSNGNLALKKAIQMNPLQPGDPHWTTKSLVRGLLTDVERLRPGTKGLGRDLVTIEARLEHEGVSFLAVTFVNLGKAIDHGLSSGHFVCPQGLKRSCGSMNPLLFRGIIDDMFNPVTGDLEGGDLTLEVSLIRQLLYFLEEVLYGEFSSNQTRLLSQTVLREMRSQDPGHSPVSKRSHFPCFFFGLENSR